MIEAKNRPKNRDPARKKVREQRILSIAFKICDHLE